MNGTWSVPTPTTEEKLNRRRIGKSNRIVNIKKKRKKNFNNDLCQSQAIQFSHFIYTYFEDIQ